MPKLTRANGELTLSLSGAHDFQAALAQARRPAGRRFDGDRKVWVYPDDPAIAERLMLTIKPTADAALTQWVRMSRADRDAELTTPLPDNYTLALPWADQLYDFQAQFVAFFANHPRLLLADDMGLGKTVQSLAGLTEYVLHHDINVDRPRLIVCPNSAKGVWQREIRRWLGKKEPQIIVDAATPKKREAQIKEGIKERGWVIVNWEQIRAQKRSENVEVHHNDGSVSEREKVSWVMKQPIFADTDWLFAAGDEIHRAKNHKSQTAHGLWMIQPDIRIGLSGTPIMNHPGELWSILRWLFPEQYHESGRKGGGTAWAYWPFYDEYVEDYDTDYGKVIVGVKNPDALRFELKNRLVRRTKAEVLNLPEKVRETIPVRLNPKQRKAYEDAENSFWLEIEQAIQEGDKDAARFAKDVVEGRKRIYELPNGAARTVRLRQIASSPALLGGEDDSAKLDAAVEIITDAQPKQFVVFTEFVHTAYLLVERLKAKKLTAEAFTGEVKDTAVRTQYEDDFQAGAIDVLVGTIPAMGESVTLTASDTVIFIERSWVTAKSIQAEDRVWRTGQQNRVTVLILEAEDTVDQDKVAPTESMKASIMSAVLKQDRVRVVED